MSGVINVLERVVIRRHYISARPDVRVFCCVSRATMAGLPTKTIGKVVFSWTGRDCTASTATNAARTAARLRQFQLDF
jgi:hypothetical protein